MAAQDAVILTIAAGPEGEEAEFLADCLLSIYGQLARHCGWRLEVQAANRNGRARLREAACRVTGSGCFARLAVEVGRHRSQRVPPAEPSGRIHTGTAIVTCCEESDATTPPPSREVIRTYDFQNGFVSDHRTNARLSLQDVLEGNL